MHLLSDRRAVGARLRRAQYFLLLALCLGYVDARAASTIGGLTHTCGFTPTHGVQCAGSNFSGELGDGTNNASALPVDVVGLSSGVRDLAIGGDSAYGEFSCVRMNDDTVKCWGVSDSNGQATDVKVPTTVPGIAGVGEISAGSGHVCVVINGGVKCWGANDAGQLGDGTTNFSAAPVDVQGLGPGSNVNRIAAGGTHTCASFSTGGIKCWGANYAGQLGNGTTNGSGTPVSVSGYTGTVAELAAGLDHSCALDDGGVVQCWGDNYYGQLGDGNDHTQSTTPSLPIELFGGILDVIAGTGYTCARTPATVFCFGYNFDGEMGDGTRVNRSFPNPVSLDSAPAFLGGGRSHVCVVLDTGALQCWGRNDYGQLGNASSTGKRQPVDVSGLSSVAAVQGDSNSTCALTSGGGVKCWGLNEFSGQIGDGSTVNRLTPVDVSGLTSGVSNVAVGGFHACALTSANGVKCWGKNAFGQLGGGTFGGIATTPQDVNGLTSGVAAVSAGYRHSCALTSGGGVKCWGWNANGQLGNGSNTNSNVAVDVNGLTSGVAAIGVGYQHSCAVTVGGAVKCWGANFQGQLGNNSLSDSNVPVDVSGLASGIVNVGAGTAHTCVRSTGGGIKCWGRNTHGESGNGTVSDNNPVPVNVTGLGSGVPQLAVGRGQTCVLTAGNGVKCWGNNFEGGLGDGTIVSRSLPTDVVGLTSGVSQIGEGGFHMCASMQSGPLRCWGNNDVGEIGDGTNYGVLVPTTSVFSLTPAPEAELAQLPPLPVPDTSASSGASVAAAPEIVVVGAPDSDADGVAAGQVFVYTPGGGPGAKAAFREATRTGKSVKAIADVNIATLQMPPEVASILDKFGGSVAVSHDGNTIAASAPSQNNNQGAVYIFKKPLGGWSGTVLPIQKIAPPAVQNGDGFGASVAITNGGTIIVGSPGRSVSGEQNSGVIYIVKGDTTYTISAPITSSNPQGGAGFGTSVAGEGSDVVVGAPGFDQPGRTDQGQVQVFREAGNVLNTIPIAVVDNPVPAAGDEFGASVSLNDGTLLVGAPGRDTQGAPDAGAAEVFDQTPSGTLTPTATLTDPGADAGAGLGTSVSLGGGTAIVGEPNADVNGNTDQGGATVYIAPIGGLFTGALIPNGVLFDPTGGSGDHYGFSVAIGDTLSVVGSPDAGTQANKASKRNSTKAIGASGNPGEAIAYGDSSIFRNGFESARGAQDGCANPNLAIPDNQAAGVTNDFTLTGVTGNVKDLNVSVHITHTFVTDLRVSLIHVPTGRVVPLYTPPLTFSCDTNDLDVTFDDQALDGFASKQCSAAAPAVEGRRLPDDWLTIMQGVSRAGPWRLKVADVGPGDTGTLDSWCVEAR